uniref:Gamma-tubulin complex component n=1 Tax=Brassica campestris TaxID=3711 RepID=A0A3P6CKV9_BRACM|nr:unnamed protein product [Brassica rapa]
MEPMTPISCPTTPRWKEPRQAVPHWPLPPGAPSLDFWFKILKFRHLLLGSFRKNKKWLVFETMGLSSQETRASSRFADSKRFPSDSSSNCGVDQAIGCYDTPVQELIVIDVLLSALVGIEGRYISIKRFHGKEDSIAFQVDPSNGFGITGNSQFKKGLVNHAFAAALRALLLVCYIAHDGIHARAKHFVGSGVLNLLQSQAKAMAGDNSVRSLLEKMTECASNAYLSILERWVYEGIIDDPYGEFFIAENRSLKKESLSQDSTAKYWSQRYSLKETIPGFLANIAATILTTGKYLNAMRECGHNVQVCLWITADLSLRTTAAAADPRHEDLTCCVDRTSLLKTLGMQKDTDSNSIEDPVSITGLETFSLSYKVQWPLSIVISKKALSKYHLIFRFLFHCKHVERQLCGAWQIHQGIRSMNSNGTAICRSSLLCRSMLKFISSLLHYLTFEVLEPNWHVMQDGLQSTRSIDEVIQHHDFFLDKCLRGCFLLLPDVLKVSVPFNVIVSQDKCTGATQWLISSSVDINSQSQKTMIRDTTVTESIFNFEREFNSELQSLGPVLSKGSQAEPYLTHLSQCILGVSKD